MKRLIFLTLFSAALASLAAPGPILLARQTIEPGSAFIYNAQSACQATTRQTRQYLVQPAENFSEETLSSFDGENLSVRGFVPPNAYILEASDSGLEKLRASHKLLFVQEFSPEWKRSEGIEKILEAPSLASASEEKIKIDLQLLRFEDSEVVKEFISKNGGKASSFFRLGLHASVPKSLLRALSEMSEIVWLEETLELQTYNFRAGIITGARSLFSSFQLSASNQIICVADTGLDTGNLATLRSDFQKKTVIGKKSQNNPRTDGWGDLNGHGTHVAGTIAGRGTGDISGLNAGMAPDANLYFISIGGSTTTVYPPTENDLIDAYNAGARLMNNSWGGETSTPGSYSSNDLLFDYFTYTHPDFLTINAAGNNNKLIATENNSHVSTPSTCKNGVCVAATESDYIDPERRTYGRTFGLSNQPFANDLVTRPYNNTQRGMAAFSSRGPCADGRIKPDIAAPGCYVFSCASTLVDPASTNKYVLNAGTSMATPVVTGCAALCLSYLKKYHNLEPSAALLKAILLNGARSLGEGQYTPNYVEIPNVTPNQVDGYGEIDLQGSLTPTSGKLLTLEDAVGNAEAKTYNFAKNTEGPVSILLCWSDFPGTSSSARHLVNDLDLELKVGETTYYCGNTTAHSDSLNNTELIRFDNLPAGNNYQLTVRGYNVMYGPQAFAVSLLGFDANVPEPTVFMLALLSFLILQRRAK